MTLGSLFDGAGTFPFAAKICGIKTLWSSEIDPFPLAITKKRFPDVAQLGDVIMINGAEIEPVDIISFGSPCQDLSVAGQRKGLAGERSGLFMDAIRIIKEMREKTNGVYPRFAVWENVPGAFSSNKGEDFRTVIEEICKVKDYSAFIPRPANRGGRWSDAGEIMADEYSVAWRVLDAQFWGVPQRRRRIFLVADFRGQRAGEILFERKGLSRNFAESRKTWKGIAKSVANGFGNHGVCYATSKDDRHQIAFDGVADTLVSSDYKDPPCVFSVDCRNGSIRQDVNGTLQAKPSGGFSVNLNNIILCHTSDIIRFILRRLTPTECARLQGMPDWWCDDVLHKDSAEYKMWGNGIALPCALYIMEGLKKMDVKEILK